MKKFLKDYGWVLYLGCSLSLIHAGADTLAYWLIMIPTIILIYTEHQVRLLLNEILTLSSSVDDAIDSLTPIKLPSNEEVEKEQKPKWISVENNLPEKDGKYLIFDGEYEVALFKKDRFIETYPTGIDVGEYTKCHYRQELFPTHWMPLPAQPKL